MIETILMTSVCFAYSKYTPCYTVQYKLCLPAKTQLYEIKLPMEDNNAVALWHCIHVQILNSNSKP